LTSCLKTNGPSVEIYGKWNIHIKKKYLRPFSKGYFSKGIESLKKCATRFLFINNEIEKQNQKNEQNLSQPVQNNEQPNSPALISPNTGFEEFVKIFFYGDNQTQTVLDFEIISKNK
jgi:hypothetical protein